MRHKILLQKLFASILIFGLVAACSSTGHVFILNNSDMESVLYYAGEKTVLLAGESSKKQRRGKMISDLKIGIGDCLYSYNPTDFNRPIPKSDRGKFDNSISPLIELELQSDGRIRLYQVIPSSRSRIFEMKPGGNSVSPTNRC